MNLIEQKDLCYTLLDKLVESKRKLIDAENKKEKWEAEQEIAAAFDRLDLKNEMQRKAYVLEQRYKPNSSWTNICDSLHELKLAVYQLEREYRIECLMLTFLCQNREVVEGED